MSGKSFWGPPIWSLIHSTALLTNPQNKDHYIKFLGLLTHLLPCDKCKMNLVHKLSYMSPLNYINGRPLEAFNYTYHIHDQANRQISQEEGIMKTSPPLDIVRNSYLNGMRAGQDFWGPSMWTTFFIFAATLKDKNALNFKSFIESTINLLPEISKKVLQKLMAEFPIDPFLRSNHDAFFYIYKMHHTSNVGQIKEDLSLSFIQIKSLYFSKLGEECHGCKL